MSATAAPAKTSSSGRLAAAAGPLLSLVIVLRRAKDLDSFRDIPGTVTRLFDDYRHKARDLGCPEDIDDASYALASALDETMLTAQWSGREAWQQDSLAKKYCSDEFVGIGFFDKLAQIRRSAVPRTEVVEVFYYCLVSGFQGKLVETPHELNDLMDQVAREIGSGDKTLAPSAYPDPPKGIQKLSRFPWLAVIVSAIVIPFLVWLLTWRWLDGKAEQIVQMLGGH